MYCFDSDPWNNNRTWLLKIKHNLYNKIMFISYVYGCKWNDWHWHSNG